MNRKIMQKLRKRKVRKHLPKKCSKVIKLVTNYEETLVRFLHRSNCFFTCLKHRFTQRSVVYNKNMSFHRISSVSKHRSFTKWLSNREMESESKTSMTTVTSQIGSAKILYKSLMHRMTFFKLNLCRDIEKNPGPGA